MAESAPDPTYSKPCLIPFVGIRLVVVAQKFCENTRSFSQGIPTTEISIVVGTCQGVPKPPTDFLINALVPGDLPEGALWLEHLVEGSRVGMHPVVKVIPYTYGMTLVKCDMTKTAQPYAPSDAPW